MTMEELFLTVLDMSFMGAVVIAVILVARLCLKRAPKVFSYALWAVALFRLLCPFSLESPVSAIPAVPEISAGQVDALLPELKLPAMAQQSPVTAQTDQLHNLTSNATVRSDLTTGSPASSSTTVSRGYTLNAATWLSLLWLTGATLMAAWGVISWVRLRKRLVGAVKLSEGVYMADHIGSPFVLGLFRPRVYLPSTLTDRERHYILLHERHHICRGDHVVKLLAYLALCIHWFDPMVWVAFLRAGKDMEMSCDEAVIRRLGPEVRADYSASLLALATGKKIIGAAPLAFGEGDTKGRIMNLAKWKKPGPWILILAGAIVSVLALLLITSPLGQPVCIRVNGQVYYQQGETIAELPEGSTSIGVLRRIIHRTGELPEEDFTGTNLEEKYAGCSIFQSGTDPNTIYLMDYSGSYLPFTIPVVAETMALLLTEPAAKLESTDLEPGMVFVSEFCVYMNPLSSTMAIGGDSRMRYILEKDSFIMEYRAVDAVRLDDGASVTPRGYPVLSWRWQEFPWSEAEWAEICDRSMMMNGFLRGRLEEVRCIQVGIDQYLLTVDNVIYLLDLTLDRRVGTYIWSIYTLVPEEVKGTAQWVLQPHSSAGKPAFSFRFDLGHTEVSAVCTQSQLIDFDFPTADGYPSDNAITIPADRALYWNSSNEAGEPVWAAEIHFSVLDGQDYLAGGTIYIYGQETTDGNGLPLRVYTAKLVGTGLTLEQEGNGGRITWQT